MPKPPSDMPEGRDGERVTLRANTSRHGTITLFTDRRWVRVDWDDGKVAPKICHQFELKQLPVDGSEKVCV